MAQELEELKQRDSLFRLWAKHAVKVVPDSDGGLLFTNQTETLVRIQRDAHGTLVARGVYEESRFAGALWARGSGPTESWSANGNELRYSTPASIEPDRLVPGRVFMSSLLLSGGTGSSAKTAKHAEELPGWMRLGGDESLSGGRSIAISRTSLHRGEATIDYTVGTLNVNFSFPQTVSPELVYFTTRMVNLDDEWSTPNKVTSRQFAALPEGNYEFQVKAILPEGQESEISSLAITVHPPWFRSNLFYAVISSTLLGLIIQFARWRIQLERRQIARLQVEVDERKSIETQLRQSQTELVKRERLHALGEMAARAAHDINNILTPVGIYGYLLKSSMPPSGIAEIGFFTEFSGLL